MSNGGTGDQHIALCAATKVQSDDTIRAAIAAGVYKDYKDAAKHMVRVSSRVYPNPDRIDIYNKKFERYMAVSDALDTVWEKFEV